MVSVPFMGGLFVEQEKGKERSKRGNKNITDKVKPPKGKIR